ncbi:hypothetical protein SDC9_114445 [bioreactor metagenome]|uniref:Uncharacterized protein n=1 Tax=bioreactor metagenome TaxID=1076179 RepID=A0A645BQN9_9ZZZZ
MFFGSSLHRQCRHTGKGSVGGDCPALIWHLFASRCRTVDANHCLGFALSKSFFSFLSGSLLGCEWNGDAIGIAQSFGIILHIGGVVRCIFGSRIDYNLRIQPSNCWRVYLAVGRTSHRVIDRLFSRRYGFPSR